MDHKTEMLSSTILNLTTTTEMVLNSTVMPLLNATKVSDLKAKGNLIGVFLTMVYALGVVGNAAAIVCLWRGERRVRNRKHLLLLTSLAVNDLVALVGMMCSKLVADFVLGEHVTQLYCGVRVVLRTFGIGSVCIAVTMALERYLALTRPFFYQKRVTYFLIRTALVVSWVFAGVVTCAPLAGAGRYFDGAGPACVRYREASEPLDYAYAVFYVCFGTLLCLVLVYCNLAVIKALYAITTPHEGGAAPLVRRVSKSSCRQRQRALAAGAGALPLPQNAATAEEVAFSRLMATLAVLFMICWLPQMFTSVLYLALGSAYWKTLRPLANVSDIMMLMNYVLNPILYVLMRKRKPLATLCHSIATCFKRGHKTSTESVSMKTSCCADTLVVTDSSVEGRPLRAHPAPPAAVRC